MTGWFLLKGAWPWCPVSRFMVIRVETTVVSMDVGVTTSTIGVVVHGTVHLPDCTISNGPLSMSKGFLPPLKVTK